MASFTVYAILNTYRGLNPKRKPKKVGGEGKETVVEEQGPSAGGKGGRKRKRAPRVEVS